jgi:RimJ/RimL family protein N-acetyltransferase
MLGSVEPSGLSWPDWAPSHGGVVLRAFELPDVDMVRELATDPYVPLIGTLPAQADEQQAAAWIDRQRARFEQGVGFPFVIAEVGTGTALGTIGLSVTGWQHHGRATVGYSVAPSARGRGVATDALRAVTAFAWSLPALHRLEAYIEPSNAASVRAAQRAGYQYEGLLRSHQPIGGTRRDMLLYAAVRPD